MRTTTPKNIETEVLLQSGRRCCLCFGIEKDFLPKKGQIAHLDRNPANNALENLAFLCLQHHDEYDSRPSQSKGLTISELKAYRDRLYFRVQESVPVEENLRALVAQADLEETLVKDAADKLEDEKDSTSCIDRLHRLIAATNAYYAASEAIPEWMTDQERIDISHNERVRCLLRHDIPGTVYGVDGEFVDDDWYPIIEPLISSWMSGILSHRECSELIWEFDERYDIDLYYVLYGVPNGALGSLGRRYLRSLVYEHGMRNSDDPQEPLD